MPTTSTPVAPPPHTVNERASRRSSAVGMPAASFALFARAVLQRLRVGDRPHRDGAFGQARHRRHEGHGTGGHDQAPVLDLLAAG